MADFRPIQQREPSRFQAWAFGLSHRRRAALVVAMAVASLALSIPFSVHLWPAAAGDGRVALAVAWTVLFAAGLLAGVKSRRNALTMSLAPADVDARVRKRNRADRVIIGAVIAVVAVAKAVTHVDVGPILASAAGPYCVPAFLLMAHGFWQRQPQPR